MPSWIKFAGGWLIAAVIALLFSWGAVAQVRNRVIRPTIEIPTTVATDTAAAAAATTTTTAPAADPTVIRVEPEMVDEIPSTSVDEAQTTSTTVQDTTTPPAPTTTTSPVSTTTTTAPPTTTTQPPATTTTTTTTTTAAPTETQTSSYTLTGGVVTISHSPGTVMFVSAIPQPGFATEQRETGPARVRIRFESETHTSDFRAEWEGDELKITQNETGEDD